MSKREIKDQNDRMLLAARKKSEAYDLEKKSPRATRKLEDWRTLAKLYEEIAGLSQGETLTQENFKRRAGLSWKHVAFHTKELKDFEKSVENYQAIGDVENVLGVWKEACNFYQSDAFYELHDFYQSRDFYRLHHSVERPAAYCMQKIKEIEMLNCRSDQGSESPLTSLSTLNQHPKKRKLEKPEENQSSLVKS